MKANDVSIEDRIHNERELEMYCDYCGLRMEMVKGNSKKTRFSKPNDKWVCRCGNSFRVRSFNEILRDLGEKE